MKCEYCGGSEWHKWSDGKHYCRGCGAVMPEGGLIDPKRLHIVGEPGPELILDNVVLPPDLAKKFARLGIVRGRLMEDE